MYEGVYLPNLNRADNTHERRLIVEGSGSPSTFGNSQSAQLWIIW